MTNVKLYCIRDCRCGTVGKEKAPIRSRGLIGVPWGTLNRDTCYISILTLPVKARNTFMERNV
jgi:hypothetical protein